MDLTPAPSNPYSQLLSLFDPRNWPPFAGRRIAGIIAGEVGTTG